MAWLILLLGTLWGAGVTNAVWYRVFAKHIERRAELNRAISESYDREIKLLREVSDGVCETLRERAR